MTTRERCMNILHYKAVDRLPAVHFGYWEELLAEWAEQGHISAELARGALGDGSAPQRELDKIIGWDCFQADILEIENLKALRNEIAYVNRTVPLFGKVR